MADTERGNQGAAGSGSGAEPSTGGPEGTGESIQGDSLRRSGRGLSQTIAVKPKRVVFPIAGKGGVGKTTILATLAEWYANLGYRADLLDMDPDNKAEGSLKALFTTAYKLRALESWTYDRLLGISLESDADIILADLGPAQGHRMIPWFRDLYRVMQDADVGFRWTAIGVVDTDIASARSVLEWGEDLLGAVDYVIVHNHYQEGVPSAWENPKLGSDVRFFREMFSPVEIRMDARRPDLQRMMRTMNVTLADVGDRNTDVPELRAPDMTLRARTYRFRAFSQFAEARSVLLP